MTVQIRGNAPGMMANPTRDTDTTLYRYELVGGALVRARPRDVQPRSEADRYLIDVLLNEDETGRYLNGVRGFVVPHRDKGCAGPVENLAARKTFKVGIDLMLAIGKNLAVGPRVRLPARLATLDGRRVD